MLIESELAGGNVQEAFRHLKGWYRAASDTQAKPCRQTMERQTSEWVDLFMQGGIRQATPSRLMSPQLKSTMTFRPTVSCGE